MADLYRVLGVPPDASPAEIVRAYRRGARASHPDSRPDDPDALARFRALTEAYDVLGDPLRRAEYDQRQPSAAPSSPDIASPVTVAPIVALAPWPPRYPAAGYEPPLRVGPVWVEPDPGQAP